MILSMTGYGRAEKLLSDFKVVVEVRSLNGKFIDLRLKIPKELGSKEMDIRKIANERIKRGKCDLSIEIVRQGADASNVINEEAFNAYYKLFDRLGNDHVGLKNGDVLASILRMPDVIQTPEFVIDEELWTAVRSTLEEALDHFVHHRTIEGESIRADLEKNCQSIAASLDMVHPHESKRIENVKERIKLNVSKHMNLEHLDESRFEQELFYYLEKIDMSEEKVRLGQHCTYFQELLNNDNDQKGKKLSFVSQEIGREINTLGAKSYSSDIQKLVVDMKDALEKMKEQLANTL